RRARAGADRRARLPRLRVLAADPPRRRRLPRPAPDGRRLGARGRRRARGTLWCMEGFGGSFNDPDLQRRLQEMTEQMQGAQTLAWADNAIKLAVDMTVAAMNRLNVQGT